MKKKNIQTNGGDKGLTHNPFAALSGGNGARSSPAPEVKSEVRSESSAMVQKVVVRREKKGRGGKTVTRVCGLRLSEKRLAEVQREMKRSLGCGASVEDEEIVLQGELTARAAKWLEAKLDVQVTIGN